MIDFVTAQPMNFLVAALYATAILLLLLLLRRNRDKAVTPFVILVAAAWFIYSLASRVYRIVNGSGEGNPLWNNVAVCLFVLAMIGLLLHALRVSGRIERGESFTGADGRRWWVRDARLPDGETAKVARPAPSWAAASKARR